MTLPIWLKVKATNLTMLRKTETILRDCSLNTVCEQAICPNLSECFSNKTATFLIMGKLCTRNCSFCAVTKGIPEILEEKEPFSLARAVRELYLKYVVLTSVTRDDLSDGGANHFACCIRAIKTENLDVFVEVLIPDFMGNSSSLQTVLSARPEVLNHNIETISRLYGKVRPGANYIRSLELLKLSKQLAPNVLTKSGLILGLGETREEIVKVMQDLKKVNCDFLTIGQYLAPSEKHIPVAFYVSPDEFNYYRQLGLKMGFKYVASGPLVRSSYLAREAFEKNKM